jgi:hypothetical protein
MFADLAGGYLSGWRDSHRTSVSSDLRMGSSLWMCRQHRLEAYATADNTDWKPMPRHYAKGVPETDHRRAVGPV